ncbi:hypothetical protein [Natronococcus jeotgali]|nr:hypothetical protein [Natronococcus jeotgali]
MTLTTFIPGMIPGRTLRNLIVSVVYLVCFPLVPFILSYAVFANYNQISDRLAMRDTPGFAPGGGAKPAAVTFVALLVTISVIASLSVAPFIVLADNGDSSDVSTEDDTGVERDNSPAVDDEDDGDDADGIGTDGFGERSFLDNSSSEEDISEEEREENTHKAFQEMLINEGYEITDGRMEEGIIYIEYRSYAEDRGEVFAEITDFAEHYTAYDDILQNEMSEEYEGVFKEQTEGLRVTILDHNDVEQRSYSIEGEWARAYYAGEISDEEDGDRIEDTIEVPDQADNGGDDDNNSNSNNND